MSITNNIAKKLIDYQSEKSFAFRLRQKRARRIKQLISDCYTKNGKVKIVDIGGTMTYWKIIPDAFLKEHHVHITIVNLPSKNSSAENDELFSIKTGDGRRLNFATDSFHIAHSNSVIEHVGDWSDIQKFSDEIKRVAQTHYVQTPNYWFPIEPHFMTPFFQWLPKSVRIKLVMTFSLGWLPKAKNKEQASLFVEDCNLLSKRELKKLFPQSKIYKERFLLLTKSLIAVG